MKPNWKQIALVALLLPSLAQARVRFIPWSPAGMRIRSLVSSGDTANVTSYTTASFTPTANALIVAYISAGRGSSTNPDVPTVTDTSTLTWSDISEFIFISTGTTRGRASVFAARAGASPASMTINATYAGANVCVNWQVFEVLGSDVANGVVQSFVQVVTSVANSTATSGTVTLAAAAQAKNRPFAMTTHLTLEGATPRTNWTEMGDAGNNTPGCQTESQWRSDQFETTASSTWTTSSLFGMIAFEIKAQ